MPRRSCSTCCSSIRARNGDSSCTLIIPSDFAFWMAWFTRSRVAPEGGPDLGLGHLVDIVVPADLTHEGVAVVEPVRRHPRIPRVRLRDRRYRYITPHTFAISLASPAMHPYQGTGRGRPATARHRRSAPAIGGANRERRMGFLSKVSAAALTVGLVAGSAPAWADFWSDAGAKFEGVTLHGVTEARRRPTTSRTCWRPSSRRRPGSRSRSRPPPGTRCTTRPSRTWRPRPASMTWSTSSRTSSTPTWRGTSSSTSPRRSKDDPVAQGAGLRREPLHHLRRLLQERRRRPLRRPDGSLHQDLPLPDRPLQRPGGPGRLQGEDRQGPEAGDDPRGIHRRSPSSSPSGARTRATSGAPPPRPTPATRPPGTSSSSRSRPPSASTTGASTPTTTSPPRWPTAAG